MIPCWSAGQRSLHSNGPTFAELKSKFDKLLLQNNAYIQFSSYAAMTSADNPPGYDHLPPSSVSVDPTSQTNCAAQTASHTDTKSKWGVQSSWSNRRESLQCWYVRGVWPFSKHTDLMLIKRLRIFNWLCLMLHDIKPLCLPLLSFLHLHIFDELTSAYNDTLQDTHYFLLLLCMHRSKISACYTYTMYIAFYMQMIFSEFCWRANHH